MTAAEAEEVRDHVGAGTLDGEIVAVWDRKGTVLSTALAILRRRRSAMLAEPGRFSADGDFSEEWTSEQIKMLDAKIGSLVAEVAAEEAGTAVGTLTVSFLEREDYCGR